MAVTVTEVNYLEMLQKIFLRELKNNASVENLFQQDGTSPYYAFQVGN